MRFVDHFPYPISNETTNIRQGYLAFAPENNSVKAMYTSTIDRDIHSLQENDLDPKIKIVGQDF